MKKKIVLCIAAMLLITGFAYSQSECLGHFTRHYNADQGAFWHQHVGYWHWE